MATMPPTEMPNILASLFLEKLAIKQTVLLYMQVRV